MATFPCVSMRARRCFTHALQLPAVLFFLLSIESLQGSAWAQSPLKIRLEAPRIHGHKSGDGGLYVKPRLENGQFPNQARWCVSLMESALLVEGLREVEIEVDKKKMCAKPGPLEGGIGLRLQGIAPGNYRLYISLVSSDGTILARHPNSPNAHAAEVEVLDEKVVTTNYHVWYHDKIGMPGTDHPKYLGVPVQKSLSDLWVFQEIIWEIQPTLIIEFGTLFGGSALYLSHLLRNTFSNQKEFKVLTVDINGDQIHPRAREGANIEFLTASSLSNESQSMVQQLLSSKNRRDPALIFLDSKHTKEHVLAEMALVSKYMKENDYLIVEDSHHNYHPVGFSDLSGEGPYEAIQEFRAKYPGTFHHDVKREKKFGFSWNPGGYLIRTSVPFTSSD